MPRGFKPVGDGGGGDYNGALDHRPIAANYTTPIYTGDAVKMVSGMTQLAAAGDAVWGIFMGCSYVDASGKNRFERYWSGAAGSKEILANIAYATGLACEVELDAGAGTISQALVGALCNLVAGTGSAANGISGMKLGAAGGARFRISSIPDYGQTGRLVIANLVKHQLAEPAP